MGAKKAELLKYGTSGDITEEYHSVVGYASIIFY
jgi:AmmeMemoRadiSam system protein B